MTGMCGWCRQNIWDVSEYEYASLVPDVPDDTPPENRPIGGLSFCSEEHLDLYVKQNPESFEGMKKITS